MTLSSWGAAPEPVFANSAEARAWKRGDVVDVWNTDLRRKYAATVLRWNESGVLVRVCDPDAVSSLYWPTVALQVWDADLEPGAAYPPRSADRTWVALRCKPSPLTCPMTPPKHCPFCDAQVVQYNATTVYHDGSIDDCALGGLMFNLNQWNRRERRDPSPARELAERDATIAGLRESFWNLKRALDSETDLRRAAYSAKNAVESSLQRLREAFQQACRVEPVVFFNDETEIPVRITRDLWEELRSQPSSLAPAKDQ